MANYIINDAIHLQITIIVVVAQSISCLCPFVTVCRLTIFSYICLRLVNFQTYGGFLFLGKWFQLGWVQLDKILLIKISESGSICDWCVCIKFIHLRVLTVSNKMLSFLCL